MARFVLLRAPTWVARAMTGADVPMRSPDSITTLPPLDLDPWTFYSLPALGGEGFLVGHNGKTTPNKCRIKLPPQDPSYRDSRIRAA